MTAPRWLGSIRFRISAAATIVLLVFMVLTALTLEKAFRESAIEARHERLIGQLYLLLGAAELDPKGHIEMPPQLNEPRFSSPGSGLYANIADLNADTEWQSNSTVGLDIPFERALVPGEQIFTERRDKAGKPFFVLGYGVKWKVGKRHVVLTFSVAEDETEYKALLRRYRGALWGWLGGMAALLLLTQFVVLRWGLTPLRRVTRELREVETGERERLGGDYPDELRGLTTNLNELLNRERAQQERYRAAMGDLAHSLKTPLAVLRNAVSDNDSNLSHTVEEQLGRMDQIVQYQLQRASTAGASSLQPPLLLKPEIEKIITSLTKVYASKAVKLTLQMKPDAQGRIDKGDLYELLGNLLDNACKFCRRQVQVSVDATPRSLVLRVEDDGPGVADPKAILARGGRADERAPGHGLGLSLVSDIVNAYGGRLEVGRSEMLDGGQFVVYLTATAGA
ncbi:ATP-binding protein [Chitinivorax sp. PXF-14]|uniref:ATP-binding protein n=1 Tax=Chitinivorax sp. PXF-14 TaxID=3230488 RepID=UPI0034669309